MERALLPGPFLDEGARWAGTSWPRDWRDPGEASAFPAAAADRRVPPRQRREEGQGPPDRLLGVGRRQREAKNKPRLRRAAAVARTGLVRRPRSGERRSPGCSAATAPPRPARDPRAPLAAALLLSRAGRRGARSLRAPRRCRSLPLSAVLRAGRSAAAAVQPAAQVPALSQAAAGMREAGGRREGLRPAGALLSRTALRLLRL